MIDVSKSRDGLAPTSLNRPLGPVQQAGLYQDVLPTKQQPRRPNARPVAPLSPATPSKPRRFTPPRTKKTLRRQRLLRIEKFALVAAAPLVIIVSARLSAFPIIGEGVIGVYGVVALVRKIPSRVSFWLASMVLVSIGVEFMFLPGVGRANNSALFVFLLLCVGLLSLVLETRRIVVHSKPTRRR